MKKYITWKRKKVNDNLYQDPNTDNRVEEESKGQILFIETPFQILDGRFISVVDHPDKMNQEQLDYFRTLDPAFEFTIITEEEANTLLSELGDVTVSNFNFTDNRPIYV